MQFQKISKNLEFDNLPNLRFLPTKGDTSVPRNLL